MDQDLATRHTIHDFVCDSGDVADDVSLMGDGIMDSTGVPSTDPPRLMEAQQQAAWNATQQDYPRDVLVPQLVAAQAAATPDAVALVVQSRGARSVLTYRELDTRANQVAHHLRALGVGPDILVGLCLERSAALVVGALGIMRAGGAYVPLDPAYPPERLAFMLQDAQTSVLVTQQHLAARLPAGPWRVVVLDAEGRQIRAEGARRKPEEAAG